MRGSGGLGFTLLGGADTVGGCFVKDIVDGPAKEGGLLQPGDQILAVRKPLFNELSLYITVLQGDSLDLLHLWMPTAKLCFQWLSSIKLPNSWKMWQHFNREILYTNNSLTRSRT